MHQAHLLRMQGHVAFMWGLLGRFLASSSLFLLLPSCMRPLLSLAGGTVPDMLTLAGHGEAAPSATLLSHYHCSADSLLKKIFFWKDEEE